MWSSMAISAATRAGWVFGRFTVPVPSRICFVRPTRLARNSTQDVIFSALSVVCSPT